MSVTTKDIQGGSHTSRLKGRGHQPTTLARTSPCSTHSLHAAGLLASERSSSGRLRTDSCFHRLVGRCLPQCI